MKYDSVGYCSLNRSDNTFVEKWHFVTYVQGIFLDAFLISRRIRYFLLYKTKPKELGWEGNPVMSWPFGQVSQDSRCSTLFTVMVSTAQQYLGNPTRPHDHVWSWGFLHRDLGHGFPTVPDLDTTAVELCSRSGVHRQWPCKSQGQITKPHRDLAWFHPQSDRLQTRGWRLMLSLCMFLTIYCLRFRSNCCFGSLVLEK